MWGIKGPSARPGVEAWASEVPGVETGIEAYGSMAHDGRVK